jgi:hypothetical protein
MKRLMMILTLGLCAACLGLSQQPEPNAPNETPAHIKADTGLRFEAVDLFVDSGQLPLSAYQIEVKAATQNGKPGSTKVKLVGVEGGEHAAFKNAPYYDPAALHEDQLKDRIILAAFNTGPDLPTGKTRVARIHIQVEGPEPAFTVIVKAAATADGTRIQAAAAAAGDAR